MERGTEHADDRNAHRKPARFNAGVESIALDHRVKAFVLGFDGFLYERWCLEDMMQAGQGLSLLEQAQYFAAAQILGVSEFKFRVRGSITSQQLPDMSFELR